MNDPDPTPDDLLVSAVLDGVASPDDVARVAGDPALTARLEQFRSVARAVGGPVPLVDPVVRDAHLARALAAFQSGAGREGAAPLAAVPAPPPPAPPAATPGPTPPPPPTDLAAARARAALQSGGGARRHRRLGPAILSVAAALVLIMAAGALLVRLGDSSDSGSSSSDEAATASLPESAESGDAGGADASTSADTEAFSPGTPSTVAPEGAPATGTGSAVDPTLPSLGTFTKAGDLADRVQGDLVLDPTPTQRATDEVCLDDFGADVTLLGRATVAGEEGLVYVESAPTSDRRLWFVDPTTVAADGTCRQLVPVQRL